MKKSLQLDALSGIHAAHQNETQGWSLKRGRPGTVLGAAPLGSKHSNEERVSNGKDGL
jgi:hypothetical protein